MKYCVQCGQELADEARFCTKCGAVSQTSAADIPQNIAVPPVDTAVDSATQPFTETMVDTVAEIQSTVPLETGPEPFAQETAAPEIAASYQATEPAMGLFPTAPAVMPPSPPRKRWPFVLGGILILLLVGGWALYSFGNFGPPQTLKLAPQDTAYYICIKPNLLQAWNAKQLKEAYLASPQTQQALDKLMKEWKQDTDTDFEQDFESWFGKEAAFIMPDINEEHFIAAIESSDDARAQASLDKLDKGESSEENYNGVRVKYNQADRSAYAIVDGFVLISNDVDLLKSTIDRKLGSPASSLADNAAYRKLESSLPWNRSATIYFDMSSIADEIAREAADLGGIGDILESYQAAGGSVSIAKDGIKSDGVVVFRDGKTIPDYFKGRDTEAQEFKAAMQMVPANSICFVRSSCLVNLLQDSYRQFKEIEPDIDEGIGEMESLFGMNIENDVINPLRGDVTLAVTPKNGDAFFGDSSVPVGGLMLMGVKDQAKIENAVDAFSDIASDGGAWVDHRQIGGGSAYYFGDSYSEQLFTLALKNNQLMIASSPELTNIVLEQQGGNLENNSSYQAAFDGLPGWNRVLYIDIQGMSNVIEGALSYSVRQEYVDYAQPLLYPIKSISGVQSTDTSKGVLCSAMFVKIGN